MPQAKPPSPASAERVARTRHPRLARALMAATLALMAFMLITALVDMSVHEWLAREDGFVEWLTFGALVIAGGVLFSRWWGFRQNRGALWRAVYLLGALAALFGAGEEISWGQRLFGWETTEAFESNRQGETNLHNLEVGGLNMNKVVFTYGLGLALGVYFLVLPYSVRRWAGLQAWLMRAGVPVPTSLITGWFVACVLIVLLIPYSRKWETLEVLVPVGALVVLLERGVVITAPAPRSPRGSPPSAAR